MSLPKCDLGLPQRGQMLGLICDVHQGSFKVPEAKAQELLAAIEKFLCQGGTKRELATLAGKLVAIAPAVQLAPLYTRRLFQAIGQVAHWEARLDEEDKLLSQEDLLYFKAALTANVGWRWLPRKDTHEFTCASDASGTGYGGHSDLLPKALMLPFSFQDQERMAAGALSSTLREVKNVCFLIVTCLNHAPAKLKGSTLICYCDNQAQ